jgi:uncharacterized protein YqiB (DUF1249 family)
MCFLDPLEKSYWLAKLCEANFERLVRLIPDLAVMTEASVACADGKPCLYLELLEHSPYTVTLTLSHCFGKGFESLLEPAVKIRVYLDARAAEVLSDHARPRVHEALRPGSRPREVLDYKWSLNYFLSQWLDHCLDSHYCFGVTQSERESCVEQA